MNNGYWKGKNVFITGATGLIGSWLTKTLVDHKANVICLIRDIVPKSNLYLNGYYKKVTLVNGNLEDYFLLSRAINEYEIDTVFHLGAQTIVQTANRSPLGTFEANIKGTWNVLEACRNNKLVKRVVVASSDKAYGDSKVIPYNEDTPLLGMHPYDCSKSCADLLSQCYYKTYKLPVGISRCGNFFGPGDLNFNRIVPGTIKSALNNESPIIRSDGTFIRDYIYVMDSVLAYMFLAQSLDDEKIRGQAFNFSNEKQYSVLDMVNLILKIMKKENLKPKILNEAKGEIINQSLCAKKAKDMLGWKSQYAVETGLKETVKWYTEFLSDKK